ncbi:MAG: hypothetical protein WAV54_15225 [Acidimicrobiales bacterium]
MRDSVVATTLSGSGSQSKWQITIAPSGRRGRLASAATDGRSNQCQHWPALTTSLAGARKTPGFNGGDLAIDTDPRLSIEPTTLLDQCRCRVDTHDPTPTQREVPCDGAGAGSDVDDILILAPKADAKGAESLEQRRRRACPVARIVLRPNSIGMAES